MLILLCPFERQGNSFLHHYNNNNNDLPYKPDPPELRDGGYFYRHLHRHADALFRAKSRHASQGASRAAFCQASAASLKKPRIS